MNTNFTIHHYETDFLCVGGGIAGMMAAINAADLGMRCTVVDKANVKRSGCGGLGNDHFICYIPEVHGDYDVFINDVMKLQNGDRIRQMGPAWAKSFFLKTNDIVKLWDSWGISMKHNGEYYFAGHALPGRTRAFLKYNGIDQKVILTKEAVKRGVKIHNRIMGYELLQDKDGRVTGIIGVDMRNYALHVFRAKAVLLGTGLANGLYPFPANGTAYGMNANPINLTGDGRMMAYRAGAELVNLEMPGQHAGVKYFYRNGQATWEGVLRDNSGKPVGPFFDKPDPLYCEITMEVNKRIIQNYNRSGRGPVFMDMTGLTRDQLNLMEHWLRQEGNCTLLRHFQQEGIDLIDTAVEFQTHPLNIPPAGGIAFNDRSETNLPGLYAAGDEGYGGIAGAAVTGWWAAEAAYEFIKPHGLSDPAEHEGRAQELAEWLNTFVQRENGAHWLEAKSALGNIGQDYCGELRVKSGLDLGLEYLRQMRTKAKNTLKAANPHELSYCISMLNMMDLSELLFIMAEDRKETRGLHRRADYELPNLTLDGMRHYIRKDGESYALTWR